MKYEVKFTLNTDPMTLTYTDLLASLYNSQYGLTLADVLGILKITGPNGILHKNAGWDTDDYSSPDIDGGTPDWVLDGVEVPSDDDGNAYSGDYIIQIKMSFNGGVSTSVNETYTFNFDYVAPTASIDVESDCKYSKLTATDETTYAITHDGESYDPINDLDTDRDMTIRYPMSAGDPPGSLSNVTGHTEETEVGPNIWTGNYDVYLYTDLTYEVELWSDGAGKAVIVDSISGETDHTVSCDECSCSYYTCIKQIDTRYQEARYEDLKEADRLARLRNDLTFYMQLYQSAKACDKDTAWICSKIAELSRSENCECDTTQETTSVEVIPWAAMASGGSSSTNQWYSGSSVPSAGLGSDDDFYLRTTNGDVYKKLSGTWTVIMNISGEDGEDGESAYTVLHGSYNIPGDPTANYTSPHLFKQYTIQNTSEAVPATDNDMIKIVADCYMFNKAVGNGAEFYITIDGEEFIRVFADHETENSDLGLIRLEIDLMRQTSKSWHARVKGLVGGLTGFNPVKLWTLWNNNLNSANDWAVQLYGVCTDNNQTGGTYDTRIGMWNFNILFFPAKHELGGGGTATDKFINQESFTASAAQVQFDVTEFSLNDNVAVFVDGVLQATTTYTRSGNSIIFGSGMVGGEIVTIIN